MPHCRHDGFAAGVGCAGDPFAVKHPQILLASAAAGDKDQVGTGIGIQTSDSVHNGLLRLKTLDAHRSQQQPGCGPAAGDNVDDILKRRSCFGCDHADALRHGGQRTFVCRVEKAFRCHLFFECVKCHLGCARAERPHIITVQLECAVPFIQRGASIRQNQHAILRREAEQPGFVPEHHAFDRGALILEREIAMAALVMPGKIGDFPADNQIIQRFTLFQNLLCQQIERCYIDKVGHCPTSLAARMETPMALSLAKRPGTK